MQKLYLDCDGVILDTINKSYKILKEMGIDSRDAESEEKRKNFYCNLNWSDFILKSGEINDSISKISKLSKYFDIEILTHVYSQNEANAKVEYFSKVLPDINVIIVPRTKEKADVVDTRDAILVDDYLPNLVYWEKKGGISVKFSSSGRECQYITITDLLDLLNINIFKKKVEQ